MIAYEKLYERVKNEVSDKRFKHILGVVERAIEYAKIYNENLENVRVAAILHDIAKEFSDEKSYDILEKYGYELDDIEKKNRNLLHSKTGAMIAKYEYNLSDDIVNAISFHTTGRANMSMLEKIIYLADATEEGRIYEKNANECTLIETVDIIKKDIDEGMIYVLSWTLQSLLRKNLLIHLDSVKAYNFYKKQ